MSCIALDFALAELLSLLRQLEGEFVGRVVLQDIKDETLFNGLTHRVDVKRLRQVVSKRWFVRVRPPAEQFQGFCLGCRREGHVGDPAFLSSIGHLSGKDVVS